MTGDSSDNLLYGTPNTANRAGGLKQTTVKTITGVEWTCMMMVRSLADISVDRTEWMKEAGSWEKWEEVTEKKSRRAREVSRRRDGCGGG